MNSLSKKQKTHTLLTIVILVLMILTMTGLSFLMVQRSKSLIMNETQRYLSELSKQTSTRVEQNIARNMSQLREVSSNLSQVATNDAIGQKIIDTSLGGKRIFLDWLCESEGNSLYQRPYQRQYR